MSLEVQAKPQVLPPAESPMPPPTPAVTPGSARSPHVEAGYVFPQHVRENGPGCRISAPPRPNRTVSHRRLGLIQARAGARGGG